MTSKTSGESLFTLDEITYLHSCIDIAIKQSGLSAVHEYTFELIKKLEEEEHRLTEVDDGKDSTD